MVIPQDLGLHLFFRVLVVVLVSYAYSCRCLGTSFVFRHHGTTFICMREIQMSKVCLDKKSNKWSSICYRTRIIDILVIITISNM